MIRAQVHQDLLQNFLFQPTSKEKLMTMFELTENDIKQIY